MNIKRRRTIGSVISLASMADIAFLLLVFFVVTSAIGKKQDAGIRPPYAQSSGKLQNDLGFTLSLTREGILRYQGTVLDAGGLTRLLAARKRNKEDISKVQITGDRDCGYGQLAPYLDILKRGGVGEVIFAAVYRKGNP